MRELLTPVVSVEVLPAKFGEKVLAPAQWRRHIFAEEWNDMLAMRRVSTVGGITGGFISQLALPYICSSADDPARLNEEFLPDFPYKKYSNTKTKFSVQIPKGYDAIYIDAPIRGIMPTPIVTNMRVSRPAAPHDYEDETPIKYQMEEFYPLGNAMVGLHPTTGLTTIYSGITLVEVPQANGTLKVYPILHEAAREIDMSVLGFRGKYMLATPIGADVYELSHSNGVKAYREELLGAARHNTSLILSGSPNFYLPAHPAARYYTITPNDYIYNVLTMREIQQNEPNVVPDYKRYTITSLALSTSPLPTPDYSFMFVLMLSTPENQLYHLYSQTSVARLFFGGHYMIDFVPGGAAGVGSAYFYFFPYGYTLDADSVTGKKPFAHEFALVGGQTAALSGTYGVFHLGAYQPKPANDLYYAPFVYVQPISEMELWNLSRVTPGATAEAFMICCLKGHLCMFRYSDLMRAASTGETARPIFAFNPIEYIRRHLGSDAYLLNYFSQHTIPPYTSVGMLFANTNAYISFADFFWSGYSIATLPTPIAPSPKMYYNIVADELSNLGSQISITETPVHYYYPTRLIGAVGNPPGKLQSAPLNIPRIFTNPPTLTTLTPSPPSTDHPTPFVYPIIHYSESHAARVLRELKKGKPTIIAEVKEEGLVTLAQTNVSTLSVVCSFGNEAIANYTGWDDTPRNITEPRTRTTPDGARFCGTIPSLDLGISPQYFTNYEEFSSAFMNKFYLQQEAEVLYEAKIPSLRFPLSPPTLHACDLVTVGLFSLGDFTWSRAVDLAAMDTEIGVGTTVTGVSISLRELGSSTASINLQLPWEYNIALNPMPTGRDALILSLPPLLTEYLKPFNLVRIRLGYTLWSETEGARVTVSPVIFEGVIDSVSTRVSETTAGARTLQVTVNCTDIFSRLSMSTVEYEPPLDGWFFPEVLEHHLINAGISPHRIISNLWIPLGALSSFLVGDNLFIGGLDAYYAYMDYPFRIDVGLDVLADAPRYNISMGSRRMDVIRQAARLCGITTIPTPYPIPVTQTITFLDFVLRSQVYEKFMPTLQGLIQSLRAPYIPSITANREGLYVQALPVGSYALRPSWEFVINTGELPENWVYPQNTIFAARVVLPDNPMVQGVFSIGLDATTYQLPTLVRVEGRRITGQPFYFVHHDFWTELVDKDGYRYKGFRIANVGQKNQNIVEPIQAFLAAWRQFLTQGYFPPVKCNLTVFGIPNLAPMHLVKVNPPLRIISREIYIPQSEFGLQYWVVDAISYSWQAGSIPTMQVTLHPPHAFLVGLVGG